MRDPKPPGGFVSPARRRRPVCPLRSLRPARRRSTPIRRPPFCGADRWSPALGAPDKKKERHELTLLLGRRGHGVKPLPASHPFRPLRYRGRPLEQLLV